MECDWWSVGAIMFEMLVTPPPPCRPPAPPQVRHGVRLVVRRGHHVRDARRLPALLQASVTPGISFSVSMLSCNSLFTLPPPILLSDDPLTTCRKIVNWRLFLKFPEEIVISPDAKDLITKLMYGGGVRVGGGGGQCMLMEGR